MMVAKLIYRLVCGVLWGPLVIAAALTGRAPWWALVPGVLLVACAAEAFARDIVAKKLKEVADAR